MLQLFPDALEIFDKVIRRVPPLSPAADAYKCQGVFPRTESFDYGCGMRTLAGETIVLRRAEVALTKCLSRRLQSRYEISVVNTSALRVQVKLEFFALWFTCHAAQSSSLPATTGTSLHRVAIVLPLAWFSKPDDELKMRSGASFR
jgi:hypothetical protein